MVSDELLMQRAMELASNGLGSASPNPLVGCVIVSDGKIIGEGWHQQFGGPHAEVNAVNSVADQSQLQNAQVYVNLEPCAHFGKTPPCADLLVRHGVKKVIIANIDTNPLVGGKGVEKLKAAGIEVVTAILEEKGRRLNRRFFTFTEQHRPFIILKWAETADHFIARADRTSKWISNQYSRQLVHKWRSEEDAILVGTNTVADDDPQLTVRDWTGRNPVRIVIDRHLRLPGTRKIFDGAAKTLCYNLVSSKESELISYVRLEERMFIEQLINDLYARGIQSLVVEGGAETLKLFIDSDLWDEARIFSSGQSFSEGIAAPVVRGSLISKQDVMGDSLEIFSRLRF